MVLRVMYTCNPHLTIYYHTFIILSWRGLCMVYGALHARLEVLSHIYVYVETMLLSYDI